MRRLASPFCIFRCPRFVVAGLVFDDGFAKAAHNAFDDALDFQCQVKIIHLHQREAGDPFAKFLGDFPFVCAGVLFDPLDNAPVNAGTPLFHDVIGQRNAAFALGMGDAKGGVKPNAEKFLQHGGEKNCVAVIEQVIQAAASAVACEVFVIEAAAKNLPERLGADGFFVGFSAKGGLLKLGEGFVLGSDVFGQRKLVLAFGIDGFLPERGAGFGCEIDHCA